MPILKYKLIYLTRINYYKISILLLYNWGLEEDFIETSSRILLCNS